jgi:Fe-S-cluster containining protein
MQLPVITSPPAPWYAEGLRFTCSQCGNCCTGGPGYVWISEIEIERLAAHLKLTREKVIDEYCRKVEGRWSLRERRTPQGLYDCIFLRSPEGGGRKSCSIYPVRPLQCRTWPFWPELMSNRANWDRASKRCHGMNEGRLFTPAEAEVVRDAADWPSNPPTSAGERGPVGPG